MEKMIQSFRLNGGTGIVRLPCYNDGGQDVIYWGQILDSFPGAQYIKNGNIIVRKLKDTERSGRKYHRIRHYPGVVLDVVLSSSFASDPAMPLSKSPYMSETSMDSHVPEDLGGDTSDTRKPMEIRSQAEEPESIIDQKMIACLKKLKKELARNSKLTSDIESLSLQNKDFDSKTTNLIAKAEDLTHKNTDLQQEFDKQLQVEARNQFALLQKRIQTLVTQIYEPQEYPIPRLFIVLPQNTSTWNPDDILSNDFRLYFLCECGKHTMSTNSKIPHHIHLAKHEGYEIRRPTEFFQEYGQYVLAILKMLKFRISVAGVAVPAISHVLGTGDLNLATTNLKMLSKTLEKRIDQVMVFLERAATKKYKPVLNDSRVDLWRYESRYNVGVSAEKNEEIEGFWDKMKNNKALEGADLRKLESFLKHKDGNKVLANLFRVITIEDHVKCVCIDHYRVNYQEEAVRELYDTVKSLEGTFDENIGHVKVHLLSKQHAERFYQALAKARSVYELDIVLDWEVTKSDFKGLLNALRKSKVRALEIDLAYQEGPTDQNLNGSRRYDPIFDIMRHPSIQSVEIIRAPDDFNRRLNPISQRNGFPNLKHIGLDLGSSTTVIKNLLLKTPSSLSSLALNDPRASGVFDIFGTLAPLEEILESAGSRQMYLRSRIHLQSSMEAEMVYRSLEYANIQELNLDLDWSTTQSDIEDLRDFLTRSNVGSLKLKVNLKGGDSNARRHELIFKIMQHHSTHSITIMGAPKDFVRVSSLPSESDSFLNLRHMEIDLTELQEDISGIKELLSNTTNLSSLGFQGDIDDCILLQLYMEIARHQTYPITFFAKSLCIPPLTTKRSWREPSTYVTHVLNSSRVNIDELVLRVSGDDRADIRRNTKGLMELSVDGKGDQFIQDAAWILSWSKLGKLVIHMEDGKHEEILESIQWEHIRHLDIKMGDGSAGTRTMKALVEGRHKWKGPVELEFFQFLTLSSETVSSEMKGLLWSFVKSTSIKTLSLFVQMAPSALVSVVKTADVSRLEEIELRVSGYSKSQVDAVLDSLANADKLQKVKLWSCSPTQEQVQRMQDRGVTLR
ncbi:hypothetical protein BGX31_009414 [Mortierella sp. GBA43]|nr:hypothetical protein BGX31_009414 [Mortierella sp. GBA43]